jgi:hypothetical protein
MSHSHSQPTPASPESIARGHEVTDASVRGIFIFTVTLFLTLLVSVAITLALFYMFTGSVDQTHKEQYAPSPLAENRPPSPAPPLQPSPGHLTLPYEDFQDLKAIWVRLANTYGDEVMADHHVHDRIPIQAAFDILAKQGLPENTAVNIPSPQGSAHSMPTPYSPGGRGSETGIAAPPGVLQK